MWLLTAAHHPLGSRLSLNPSLRHPDLIWFATVLEGGSRSPVISSSDSPSRNLNTAFSSAQVSSRQQVHIVPRHKVVHDVQ